MLRWTQLLTGEHGMSPAPEMPKTWFRNQGLFSDHFITERLHQWKEWGDLDAASYRKKILALFELKKDILPQLKEAQTEQELIQPIFDILGYSYIVQAPTKTGKKSNRPDYALYADEPTKNKAYKQLKKNNYVNCIGIADAKYWERELDLAKSSEKDSYTNQNPSFQIVNYLTGTQQKWGILTNGRNWRLYYIKSHMPLGNFYEIDLVKLLTESTDEEFKYFLLFFRKDAPVPQTDGETFLDHIFNGSNQYSVELENDIKQRAFEVVELLCRGYAAGLSIQQLDDATLKQIYYNSLILLYRLLFIFYAEARELLPLNSNASYRDNYSIYKITKEIDDILSKEQEPSSQSNKKYKDLCEIFHLIDKGDAALGIPHYDGGLFDEEEHNFIENHTISDNFLITAINKLARVEDKSLKKSVAVDYNTLSERHLGSIYEGLLEFKPFIPDKNLVRTKEKKGPKYVPEEKNPRD